MTDYGKGFRVSRNFNQAHLQEVGLTQIRGDHDFFLIIFQHDIFQDKLQGIFQTRFQNKIQDRFQDRQTPPNNPFKSGVGDIIYYT